MSVAKQNAAGRQAINVRRLSLRVPTHASNPVVQIIHRNKQDIGMNGLRFRHRFRLPLRKRNRNWLPKQATNQQAKTNRI